MVIIPVQPLPENGAFLVLLQKHRGSGTMEAMGNGAMGQWFLKEYNKL